MIGNVVDDAEYKNSQPFRCFTIFPGWGFKSGVRSVGPKTVSVMSDL